MEEVSFSDNHLIFEAGAKSDFRFSHSLGKGRCIFTFKSIIHYPKFRIRRMKFLEKWA